MNNCLCDLGLRWNWPLSGALCFTNTSCFFSAFLKVQNPGRRTYSEFHLDYRCPHCDHRGKMSVRLLAKMKCHAVRILDLQSSRCPMTISLDDRDYHDSVSSHVSGKSFFFVWGFTFHQGPYSI